MRVIIPVMIVIVCFLLAGAVPIAGGAQAVVFRTPAFIGLMAVLAAALVVCSVRRRPALRQIGFWLAHLGAAAILLGGFLGHLRETKAQFRMPVGGEQAVRYLGRDEADRIDLEFGFTVKSLKVERYDPDYALYRPEVSMHDGEERTEYVFVRVVRLPDAGEIDLGPAGNLDVGQLRSNGEWVVQSGLKNGWLLEQRPVDKHYEAVLLIYEDEDDDEPDEAMLAVNHPVTHNGWRLYLMDYDDRAGQRGVTLLARRDPGRGIVIAGIWCTLIGVTAMCWLRGRRTP
ncbi:MAG: hypothetical protein ABIF82_10145 [Planctomycetota bacterium]